MAKRRLLVVALAGCLIGGRSSSAAQTLGVTTGSLNGTVTDVTGGLLPGVTVVASSDALMGTRTAVTDARGRYEVPAVPPGEYTLVFSLPGFQPVRREGVRAQVGATASVDVVLGVASQDAVVVRGGPPLIDRSNTTIVSRLDARQLADLPASRSPSAILAATPAVQLTRFDVGGSTAFLPGPYTAYGTVGPNRPTLEGIAVTGYNPMGFSLDYGSFEQVSVGVGAFSAETAWPSVSIQATTKSGGNVTRGTVYLDYESGAWQSFNIDDGQILRGAKKVAGLSEREANRMASYRDANVDVGGPVKRDTLWWYTSIRANEGAARQVTFPVKPVRTEIRSLGGKVTARASGNHNFVAFGQTGWNRQPNRLDGYARPMQSINLSEESTSDQSARGGVWKLGWDAILRKKFFVEVFGGQFVADRHERPNGKSPRVEDTFTFAVQGGNRDWEIANSRDQLTGSVTFQTNGTSGSHHTRIGGNFERYSVWEHWNSGFADGVLLLTQKSTPSEVQLFQVPSTSLVGVQWYSAFVNDTWQIKRRLTLKAGLRFDRYRGFLPAQEHRAGRAGDRAWARQTFSAVHNLIDWNLVAPRIGVVHDLRGDGRTLVKATYGRYWLPPGTDLLFNANPNSREWWEKFTWRDANGDDGWDPGEEVRPAKERRGGTEVESLDPGLKPSFVHEATLRLESELLPNLSVDTGIVWRGDRQPFLRQNLSQPSGAFTRPIAVTDPGVDGQPGTADDGHGVVIYDLETPPTTQPTYRVGNVPGSSDNLTWEVTARRRLARRWSLVAGFAHTWASEHANIYFGQTIRTNMYPLTPNDLINTRGGGRHEFRVWSARVFGTYEGPWGLRITPFFRHQSGQPYGRTFTVSAPNLGTSIRVLAEPIGTRRMDNVTLLDLRVEKGFPLGSGRRLSTFVDVFNVLNANPEANINWLSGTTTFQSPIAIVPPRIARVGVNLAW